MLTIANRIKVERQIADEVIRQALNKRMTISVNDGEATTLVRSSSLRDIKRHMMTTDEDVLIFHLHLETTACGWVKFVYGNDGFDVIHDYTTNLEAIVAPAQHLADRLELEFA